MAKDTQALPGPPRSEGLSFIEASLLFLGFLVLAFAIYRPALGGPFFTDDFSYIVENPFIASLDSGSVFELFRPGGAASLYVVNYSPLHLLWLGVERAAFGSWTPGYHVLNVVFHVLNAVLLVVLLRRSHLASLAALGAGLLFLVHPANVEAVAWISQSKTNVSLAFSLAALIGLRNRPFLSVVLFAVALLFKASALFVLPMGWALAYSYRMDRRHAAALVLWTGIFLVYAVLEMQAFEYGGRHEEPLFADSFVHFRTVTAIGMRYLVMAATSFGVSALQQPEPVQTWLDPFWLLAIPVGLLLLFRIVVTLRKRQPEAAFWIGAAAAFAPVSQIFPFIFPMADRYLYPVLPGLLGGAFLALQDAQQRFAVRRGVREPAARGAQGRWLVWPICALAIVFAFRSAERATLWADADSLVGESARNYPDGAMAFYMRAREAAQRGDPQAVVDALKESERREGSAYRVHYADPFLAPVRAHPVFMAFAKEQALRRIQFARENDLVSQHWLRVSAHDHIVRGEYDEALVYLERARRVGGVFDDVIVQELEAAREMIVAKRRGDPVPQRFRPVGTPPGG
jgi:hypothetical protein